MSGSGSIHTWGHLRDGIDLHSGKYVRHDFRHGRCTVCRPGDILGGEVETCRIQIFEVRLMISGSECDMSRMDELRSSSVRRLCVCRLV